MSALTFIAFEPLSFNYRATQSNPVQSVTREFVPNVYRVSNTNDHKPLFTSTSDLNGGESDQSSTTYGQAHSINHSPNEMNSPYYSKSNVDGDGDVHQSSSFSSSLDGSDSGDSPFTPIMSVEDAFRKYFPVKQTESDQSDQAQQQQQQQQVAVTSEQNQPSDHATTKYVNTYADDDNNQVRFSNCSYLLDLFIGNHEFVYVRAL